MRGPGLLEVDANPNPLREGLLGDLLTVREAACPFPAGKDFGLEPDIKAARGLRSLHLERRA